LEALEGNHKLNRLGRVVDLSVLQHLECVVDHAAHGILALFGASERGVSDKAAEEVFQKIELGELISLCGEEAVLALSLELLFGEVSGFVDVGQSLVHGVLESEFFENVAVDGRLSASLQMNKECKDLKDFKD
jgi:hypothetical protein